MRVATSGDPETCTLAWAGRFRPRMVTVFWASLAMISLAAFKLAQARLQPDAIATGVPGFLYRLVLQPLEWLMHGVFIVDPAVVTLQAGAVIAISGTLAGLRSVPVRPGEGRSPE